MLGKERIHSPPLTPFSRVVNIRSVHTAGSARTSPAGLAVAGTIAGLSSVGCVITGPFSCASFAPSPLRLFLATTRALTPVHLRLFALVP